MTEQTGTALRRAFLLPLVMVTGATILCLEILGTRVIGTHYGSSLYVWAALLSVTLVCLAIGYAIGGRLADRFPRGWVLCLILLAAGLAILAVPLLTGVLRPLDAWLGLAWGAIASALVIFFLPLTLLAMSSPFVIRLLARDVRGVGSVSGTVYALSTVGSVAGVLFVSLWMIPVLGTRQSVRVCAAALIVVAVLGLLVTRGRRAAAAVILLPLPFLVGSAGRTLPGELFRTESPFGVLRVLQRDAPGRGTYRMLMVNGIMQTGMPLDIDVVGPGDLLESDRYFLELLPYHYPDLASGRKGVLIGLAGGMFARVMEFYDVDLTAVEIDVKVAELAKAYFGYRGDIYWPSGERHPVDVARFPNRERPRSPHADFEPEPKPPYRGRAVIQDGRQYLLSHPEKVGFIVVDAYTSDTIPFHLITREFFALVRSRLADGGILAINYIGRPAGDRVTDSLFRTLNDVFGAERVKAYRTRRERDQVQVITIFACTRPMTLEPRWVEGDVSVGVDPLSYELAQLREETVRPGGIVITDDLNPIDLARAAIAIEWRRQTMRELDASR
ncbi:MAG: fused MFS/spermidine synthase [Planctomycetota bacterium]